MGASPLKYFVGRKDELEKIQKLYDRKIASLSVIKGRRRVGKSRFVLEFARKVIDKKKSLKFYTFTGLAPNEGVTAQMQRDHFGKTLSNYLNIPSITFNDWTDAFFYLSQIVSPGDIILFDELSWMGIEDPGFVSKLKDWWDRIILEKPQVFLVLCSSVSTWIEDNILNSTAFFGRVTLTITLEPLSIPESTSLLKLLGFKGSTFEIYKLLSVFGGIPWYIEKINPAEMADENIKMLCFEKSGLLVLEFDRIFHDLFNASGSTYKKILDSLKNGMKTLAKIREEIKFERGGSLSKLMANLIESGFVQEHAQWDIKKDKLSKQSLYRISDPYIRFYLKYIEPSRIKIDMGAFKDLNLNQLPGFEAQMGLQVESLLLQNRQLLLQAMGVAPADCSFDGPFRQTTTTRFKGCQIDYLVQTRTKNLFLCEFKFKRRELGSEIIDEVNEKMKRISIPRGYALVPVLFHIGGLTDSVYDKNYFYRIVDIADFLEENNGT